MQKVSAAARLRALVASSACLAAVVVPVAVFGGPETLRTDMPPASERQGCNHPYRGDAPAGWRNVLLNGEPKSGTTWLEVVVHAVAKAGCSDPANQCTYDKDCRDFSLVPTESSTAAAVRFTPYGKHFISPSCDWFQQGFANTMSRLHKPAYEDAAVTFAKKCGYKGTLSLKMSSSDRARLGEVLEQCARTAYNSTATSGAVQLSEGCNDLRIDVGKKKRNQLVREFDTVLLVLRDPREVAISSYFHVRKLETAENIERNVRIILPGITMWIAMRYHLAVLGGEGFQFLYYNAARTTLEPYKVIAEALGLNMSYATLRNVRTENNAENMRSMEQHGILPGHGAMSHRAKVRSAGTKTIADYGLSDEFLDEMEQFVMEMLPRPLLKHMASMMVTF